MPKQIAVLAIDGGGIRGVIPATILAELERRCGNVKCGELFDLIAGTSTGGIIALGLTKPDPARPTKPLYGAESLVALYKQHGKTIFHHHGFNVGRFDPTKLFRASYPTGPLEGILKQYFGGAKVSEAVTDLIVTSFDISAGRVFMFKRSYALQKDQRWDYDMWQAARATSAAPTYFPPFVLGDPGPVLVDGGVCVNDPAMCAYVEAVGALATGADGTREDVEVLVVSIGTGDKAHRIGKEAAGWGLIEWARPVLDVVFDGVSDAVDYQLRQLYPPGGEIEGYYRFQADMAAERVSSGLDDASDEHIGQLEQVARHIIEANSDRLDELAEQLGSIAAARGAPPVPVP